MAAPTAACIIVLGHTSVVPRSYIGVAVACEHATASLVVLGPCYQCQHVLTPSRSHLWLGALLMLSGCTEFKHWMGMDDPPPAPAKSDDDVVLDVPPDLGGGSLPPQPLVRAERKLRFPAKSGEHMGFSLTKLIKQRALAGAAEIPEWSQEGEGAARSVHDDDLRTSWTCKLGPERACAIGLHFPEPAEVEAVRLFAATPPKQPHTRPALVRVHTADGWGEARLADEPGLWHVLLGEPVLTRNITVEITEVHDDAPVHLAEIEVYGRSGVSRTPLTIDMERRGVSFDGPMWRKKHRTHTAGISFVETVDIDGRPQRLLPGSALIGATGDRLMLLEHASWSTCSDHQGTYSLLDTQTRVLVPLGDMGGFAGSAFRHTEGLGFVIGRIVGDDPWIQAVLLDRGNYERRSTSRLDRRDPRTLLGDWKVSDTPLSRSDALPLGEAPPGCEPASAEALASLSPHLPRSASKVQADTWSMCTLGSDGVLMASSSGACGRSWMVAVIDTEGELMGLESGSEGSTQLRLRRIDQEAMLVEQWGNDDQPHLFYADSGTLRAVDGPMGFSLRPPAGCRKPCSLDFSDIGPGT